MCSFEKVVFVISWFKKDATSVSANEELDMKMQAIHNTNTNKFIVVREGNMPYKPIQFVSSKPM